MATAELASNGYRIAKSWQYQDSNMPDAINSNNSDTPLNNNTLRPILMANSRTRLAHKALSRQN